MEENKDLKKMNIGLVLAGGGAKGAYEVGVFKALSELGLIDQINVISGTSVGAVNALLLSMNDDHLIESSWTGLSYSRFINAQERIRKLRVPGVLEKIKNIDSSIFEQLRFNDMGLLSQSGVRKFIEEYVSTDVIKQCKKVIYACAYNIDKEEPEYFNLKEYNNEDFMNIVVASCAIPFIFKSININGNRYADGGINSPEYSRGNADNVPLKPLKNHQCDMIIVVHLSYRNSIDRTGFEDSNIIEIYPSTPLELVSGTGGIRINQSTLTKHIELGYRDAMVVLAPIVINILKGKSIKELITNNEEKNKELKYN